MTVIDDYWGHRAAARRWARIALDNKASGLPWHAAAKLAHQHLSWALFII